MSKKKRPDSDSPQTSTAVVSQPAVSGVSRTPTSPPASAVSENPSREASSKPGESFLATPLGRVCHRLFRVFSSLQLAILLLSLFTFCLIQATLLESWHDAAVAGQLIYKTWWFTLLLFTLGTNILCAALKKMDPKKLAEGHWPWKRYQTGFLITHTGLITLVFGGLLTAIGGEEGQIQMLDAKFDPVVDPNTGEKRSPAEADQTTNTLVLTDEHRLIVTRIPLNRMDNSMMEEVHRAFLGKELSKDAAGKGITQRILSVSPGSFPWHDEPGFRANMSPWLRLLRTAASPFRGKSFSLDDASLKLVNYFPNTELWPYSSQAPPATKKDGAAPLPFPAVELVVESKLFSAADFFWVTGLSGDLKSNDLNDLVAEFQDYLKRWFTDTAHLRSSRSNALVQPTIGFEFQTANHPEQVKEFLQPPAQHEMGPEGQLALFIGPERRLFRIAIDKASKGKLEKLGDTGLSIEVKDKGDLFDELPFPKELKKEILDLRRELGAYPFVRFVLHRGDTRGEFLACSRLPNLPLLVKGDLVTRLIATYHYPDALAGRSELQGAVQFLRGPDDKTYFRAFGAQGNLSAPGEEIDLADQTLTQGLPWRPAVATSFRSMGYLPRAYPGSTMVPRNLERIGASAPGQYQPSLVGVVRQGSAELPFQVRMSQKQPTRVIVGKEGDPDYAVYLLRYIRAARKLDFDVTLNRAFDTKDPGTEHSGTYQSDITIHWLEDGKPKTLDAELYMNHTKDFGGYRLFQANFRQTDLEVYDQKLKMDRKVNLSGITLARDPGLHVKYAGVLIVVGGIFTMFYMKAYFFKARGQSVVVA